MTTILIFFFFNVPGGTEPVPTSEYVRRAADTESTVLRSSESDSFTKRAAENEATVRRGVESDSVTRRAADNSDTFIRRV